jgi:gluconate 2-dehydrogenase gamma chain
VDDEANGPALRRRGVIASLISLPAAAASAAAQEQAPKEPPALSAAPTPAQGTPPAGQSGPQPTLTFFNDDQARTMSALLDRVIPHDDMGPGAVDAGVLVFLDRQLGGAWGAGAQFYKAGPFQQGTAQQGYQLPMVPADLFRHGLAELDKLVAAQHGKQSFADLDAAAQEALMHDMQAGHVSLGGVPGNVFMNEVVNATMEGFFSDPVYEGNRDMVGWKLVGFPGAYASWSQEIERHNLAWNLSPISIAEHNQMEQGMAGMTNMTPQGAKP